jgi:acetyltransferase-like isoleucine patch superfamily enzyme
MIVQTRLVEPSEIFATLIVSLRPRCWARVLLTHLNVGYEDHPLTTRFPTETAEVTILRGSFVGVAAVVLAGCRIGPKAFVAAAAPVNRNVAPGEVVGGCRLDQLVGEPTIRRPATRLDEDGRPTRMCKDLPYSGRKTDSS